MARIPCLLEPFRNPVTTEDIQSCLLKALMVVAKQRRLGATIPHLWILTPTASQRILNQFRAEPEEMNGIHSLAAGLHTSIVVIHQLPPTRETRWLRLLGRDGIQKRAIEEVLALPQADPSRWNVLELLGNWKIMLDEPWEWDTTPVLLGRLFFL